MAHKTAKPTEPISGYIKGEENKKGGEQQDEL
jgi:hypothetical protein